MLVDQTGGVAQAVDGGRSDASPRLKSWWIVCPFPGRIWVIQAENDVDAATEAFKRNGRVIREAV